MFVPNILVLLCATFVTGKRDTYRAGYFDMQDDEIKPQKYSTMVEYAAYNNLDLLVLPSVSECFATENHDEIIKAVARAAKKGQLYVVAHLCEKDGTGFVRNNVIFDRDGAIVTAYSKPLQSNKTSEIGSFTTSFGVKFGLLTEEDMILQKPTVDVRNFVLTSSNLRNPFVTALQSASSWAYVNDANVVANNAIYAKEGGTKIETSKLVFADLFKNGISGTRIPPVIDPSKIPTAEDLSQYTIRPLDVEASVQGYTQAVCHKSFCCEFYVKTNSIESNKNISYGLAVFEGIKHSSDSGIGVQNCAVFAYTGLYKHVLLMEPDDNKIFEKVSITANFTENTTQYPFIITPNEITNENFELQKTIGKHSKVTVEVFDISNFSAFGIFSRDFSKDSFGTDNVSWDLYVISKENLQDFFDYLWIRIRILLFIVSIYILEMM